MCLASLFLACEGTIGSEVPPEEPGSTPSTGNSGGSSNTGVVGIPNLGAGGAGGSGTVGSGGGSGVGGSVGIGGSAGAGGSGGAGSIPPPEPRFECASGTFLRDEPLRRLTREQFVFTVTDLVTKMAGAQAAQVMAQVNPLFGSIVPDQYTSPRNKGKDGYRRADQTLTQIQMDAQYALALKIGQELTNSPTRITALFGTCATDAVATNDVTCVDAFLRNWGAKILRTPLSADDVTFYRQALRGTVASREALADVIALLFASPRIFFLVEEAGTAPGAGAALKPYELAARLSYHLWNQPPDDALIASAASGELATAAGYEKQVDRLLADPRAESPMTQFFDEWFRLHETPDLAAGVANPSYKDYRAMLGTDIPTAASRQGMIDDVLGLTRHVYGNGLPPRELLTNRASFTRDTFVSKIYGVAPWNGTSAAPLPPSPARVGLITRPAFVASGSYSTGAIRKGARIRMDLLCDPLGEAPPDALDLAAAVKPTGPTTGRELAELQTKNAPCSSCHVALNALGFATENFDGIGRERTSEKIFDENGTLLADRPLNTVVTPRVVLSDARAVTGAGGVVEHMVQSRKFESCMVAQYFRFTFSKVVENPSTDGCFLSRLEQLSQSGASLKNVMRAFVTADEFKRRVQP